MPSARCWKMGAPRKATSKSADLPRERRNSVVSEPLETELSETREPAQKNWRRYSSQQWASFVRDREEQVFLVLTLLIGALVGLVVVAFILVTSRFGARLYPAGGAAWGRPPFPFCWVLPLGVLPPLPFSPSPPPPPTPQK